MPAEWEPHRATWIAWPHNRDDWPGKFAPIPWVYAEIVRHLHRSERVRIITTDPARPARLLARAGVDLSRIDFFPFPTDRSWTRDYGPMFVRRGRRLAIHDWRFNGWAKYSNWRRDRQVARRAAQKLGVPLIEPGIVLEGGAIDVNGRGTLLTTEECLLSNTQQRNPGLSRAGLEAILARHLGVRHFLWLRRGIAGDDTHGHIDDIARFAGPSTVVAAVEEDPADPNHAPLRENLELLRSMQDQDGRPLRVVPLPMPAPLYFDGRRLPASYANFYIANNIVLVPTFDDPNDRLALATLAELFPGRQVAGIHSVDLVWGLGTLHCLTQQEPA
ncbi:MAG TPA: agmatine deiminase family protein [Bryobacterales bacterium]|nr:agmatine deiminase family protein [Bryobacterales bacterium]